MVMDEERVFQPSKKKRLTPQPGQSARNARLLVILDMNGAPMPSRRACERRSAQKLCDRRAARDRSHVDEVNLNDPRIGPGSTRAWPQSIPDQPRIGPRSASERTQELRVGPNRPQNGPRTAPEDALERPQIDPAPRSATDPRLSPPDGCKVGFQSRPDGPGSARAVAAFPGRTAQSSWNARLLVSSAELVSAMRGAARHWLGYAVGYIEDVAPAARSASWLVHPCGKRGLARPLGKHSYLKFSSS